MTTADMIGCLHVGYLFNVFYHNIFHFSYTSPHSVDCISIGVTGKVPHALLQNAAELCVVLVCNCILRCFRAVCPQELLLDVIKKCKWNSTTQGLQSHIVHSLLIHVLCVAGLQVQ